MTRAPPPDYRGRLLRAIGAYRWVCARMLLAARSWREGVRHGYWPGRDDTNQRATSACPRALGLGHHSSHRLSTADTGHRDLYFYLFVRGDLALAAAGHRAHLAAGRGAGRHSGVARTLDRSGCQRAPSTVCALPLRLRMP